MYVGYGLSATYNRASVAAAAASGTAEPTHSTPPSAAAASCPACNHDSGTSDDAISNNVCHFFNTVLVVAPVFVGTSACGGEKKKPWT